MDALNHYIGGFGYLQLFIFLVASLYQLPGSMQMFQLTFYTPNVDFWCARPKDVDLDVATWKELSSPLLIVDGEEKVVDKCNVYKGIHSFVENLAKNSNQSLEDEWMKEELLENFMQEINKTTTATTECDSWEYDMGRFTNTMTDQFDLVCQRNVLISTSNSLAMLGAFFGTIFFGHVADRIGRRRTALYSIAVIAIISIGVIFCQSFISFMVLRVITSCFDVGVFISTHILLTEVCSSKYRASMGNLFWITFGMAFGIFAGIAYGLRNWQYMQIAIAVPYIFIAILIWLCPESPRWLLSVNRIDEAIKEIKRAAKWNGISLPEDRILLSALEKLDSEKCRQKGTAEPQHHSILVLFRWPHLRWKTLNLYFCFAVNCFLYFGMTFNTNQLKGDPFVNFTLSGVMEIIAAIMSAFFTHFIGRRTPLTVCMVIAGLACFGPIVIPTDMITLQTVFPMLAKLFITASFCMLFILTEEIFPTVVRSIGLGSCGTVSSIASMLAPYVKELGIYTSKYVPPTVFGVLALASGLMILLLPETKNRAIPDSIEESLTMHRKEKGLEMKDGITLT